MMNGIDFVSKSIPEEFNDDDEDDEELIDDIEQYVQIRPSHAHQNEAICRVTCPDKTGLGADLARTIFDFGLVVVKGDFATDGQWAFVLLTIYAPPSTHELQRSSKSGGRGKGSKNKKKKKTKNEEKSDESSDDESDGDDTATRNDDTTSRHRSDSGAENSEKSTNLEEEEGEENEESDDDETEEEEEEEKAVNWKLLQMRLENLCPKKLSIAKSGKESNGRNSVNESDRATNLQKRGGRHSRKSSSRLDEIINANNKNGGKSHLEDMDGDHRSNNHEDDTNRRRRSQVSLSSNNNNSSRLMKQQQSYSNFHDYFDDDDEYYKPSTFILRVELDDRVGLLRGLTLTLWECALIVQRAHISTSPANTAVDLFYVMDTKDELPNEDRVQKIEVAVRSVVAHGNEVKVGLHQVTFYAQGDYITRAGWLDDFSISQVESASATEYPSCDVWVDNLMSERHTVFQMISRDRKGLLYDILRASKELKVQIYYAKVEMKSGGLCEIDLFCERMTNDENARYLCQKYKQNIERPVAVQITSKGIDDLATEMRVICPLDFTGVTRPRVLLDATEALRRLNVMVFKADIVIDPGFSEGEQGQHQQEDFMIHRIDGGGAGGSDGLNQPGGANLGVMLNDQTTTTSQGSSLRKSGSSKSVHRTLAREVHRFILTDERGMPISNVRDRKTVCDAVLKNLLGLRGANEYFPGMSEVSEGSDYYNASSDEYGDSDDDDDNNFDVGHYGVGRIGGARRANNSSSRRKKSSSGNVNNNNKGEGGGGGYIGSAIGFAKRLLLFQKK